jgi:hypothetical protein
MGYNTYHDTYSVRVIEDAKQGLNAVQSLNPAPKIAPSLCLCGSLKFWDEMIQANAMLVTKNIISIPSGFSMKYPEKFPVVKDYVLDNPEKMKKIFDELHYQKIMMADGIWVLNVDDYIGDSTKREIQFCNEIRDYGKRIFTIEPCSFCAQNGIKYEVVPLDCLGEFPQSFYTDKYSIFSGYQDAYQKFTQKIDGK